MTQATAIRNKQETQPKQDNKPKQEKGTTS